MPPIPAHALELETPWNCAYCQKGSKCPYLTESLDVLQNLISDDEQSRDGDAESMVMVESDQEDYEGSTKHMTTQVRKRKVCLLYISYSNRLVFLMQCSYIHRTALAYSSTYFG